MLKKILLIIGVILLDVIIYLVLGISLMRYDDFYDESKGQHFSLESMNNIDKAIYITFNLWGVINIAIIIFLLFKLYNYWKNKTMNIN